MKKQYIGLVLVALSVSAIVYVYTVYYKPMENLSKIKK